MTVDGEPFVLAWADVPRGSRRLIEAALALLGGCIADHRGTSPRGVLVGVDSLAPDEILALGERFGAPLFLFLCGRDERALDGAVEGVRALTGASLEARAAHPITDYVFSRSREVWPFSGLTLAERHTRSFRCLVPRSRGVEPLMTCRGGCCVVKIHDGRRPIVLSTVDLPELALGTPLKDEFRLERFAGLLPLLLFARSALGDLGWRRPEPVASLLVDDANLRLRRYGFLDYRELTAAAREHEFHTGLAMIPLDYRKTRDGVARLFRANADRLSIVPHGIDHRKREFEAAVSPPKANDALLEALARMVAHEQVTGIPFARAMTFPHGVCNATWLEAMRTVGLEAAIASRGTPFGASDDVLHELYPAQATFRGFPVINRFKAERPKEELLFHAWLGKPLIVYTHHGFFRDGLQSATEVADFLNRQVAPKWRPIATIVRLNYQLRMRGGVAEIRVFANRVLASVDSSATTRLLVKPGDDFSVDERCYVNGTEVVLTPRAGGGLWASVADAATRLDVRFGPARTPVDPLTPRGVALVSRLRRAATELRDQAAPFAARLGITR